MDAQRRTRLCLRDRATPSPATPRGSRQIVIPMARDVYDRIWSQAAEVRLLVEQLVQESPELFPCGIEEGFELRGRLPESRKMPGVRLRQLRLRNGQVYSLRPSFAMSDMCGAVDDVESPLLLLSYGVPCWLVTKIFGRNDMHWHRQLERLGRNSLVGTTVRDPQKLPEHLTADEHHADWSGKKGYVACASGGDCLLGVALTKAADEAHLTAAYGQFAEEVGDVDPKYAPRTANTDGWFATRNAFRALFPQIVLILCFLHGFLKIRDRCRKAHDLHARVWHVYRAETAGEFRQRMQTLREACQQEPWPKAVQDVLEKLWKREAEYAESYAHPGCHRTRNAVDRPMNRLTRILYAGRGLHGHQRSSERRLRGWALLHNFRPFAPRAGQARPFQSPAHRLNQKQYATNWLHNLQISASLGGHRRRT